MGFLTLALGHHTLFERGIIHRDVSVQNLLLGRPIAPDGYRGVLIDLDMACRTEDCKSCVPADPHIVCRVSYSCRITRLIFLAGNASIPVRLGHPYFDRQARPTPGLHGRS